MHTIRNSKQRLKRIRPSRSGRVARPLLRVYASELNARMGRDLGTRLSGVAVLGGAAGLVALGGGVSLPAPAAFALGLTSFGLACLGVLFLVYGAGLRDRWRAEIGGSKPVLPRPCSAECRCLDSWAFEGRVAIAAHLLLCAQRRMEQEAMHGLDLRPTNRYRS